MFTNLNDKDDDYKSPGTGSGSFEKNNKENNNVIVNNKEILAVNINKDNNNLIKSYEN
jgi:hypothetical protein